MSKKDIERAKQFVYRNGIKIPRTIYDQQQREIEKAKEDTTLKELGLIRGKHKIILPKEL